MAKVNLFELGKKLSQQEDLSSINSMLIIEPEDCVGAKFEFESEISFIYLRNLYRSAYRHARVHTGCYGRFTFFSALSKLIHGLS